MHWGGGSIQGEYRILGQSLDSALLCFGHWIQEKTEVFRHRGSNPALSHGARNRLENRAAVWHGHREKGGKGCQWQDVGEYMHTAYSMYSVLSPTVVLEQETEEGVGRELKRSRAECARGGLETAGLSLLSGMYIPPLDNAGLGAGASNRTEGGPWV